MSAQDVYQDWVFFQGTQNYFLKSVVKTDANRNVYQAGATVTGNGYYDVILSKSNPQGIEIWTTTFDKAGFDDAAVDIYIDSNDNIYVAGTTFNTNNNGYSLLILKYNSSGTLLWQNTYNNSNSLYNVATSISVDNQRIYIGGITYNYQTEADFLAVSYSLSGSLLWDYSWDNIGLNDGITSIYKKDGRLYLAGGTEVDANKWKYCIQSLNPTNGSFTNQTISGGSSNGIDRISDLAQDADGNVYVTGGVANLNSGYDYQTLKLDSTLNILWEESFNSSGSFDDIANSLAVDNLGNVYVTGQSQTNENGTDYNTLKYSSNGTQQWLSTYNADANGADSAKVIIVDENQDVIVTGVSENGSNTDIHTVKYSSSGAEIWQIDFNGLENGDDRAFDIAIDEFGDIIVAGQSFIDGNFRYVAIKYKEVEVTDPFGSNIPDNKTGSFTANSGQLTDLDDNPVDQIKYSGSDGNANVFISDTAMSYSLILPGIDSLNVDTICTFNVRPYDGKSEIVYGKEQTEGFTNYYFPHISGGRERVPSYKSIVYPNVWRSIDLTITKGPSGANYYYVVKSGATLSELQLLLTGADAINVDSNTGELVVETNCGTQRFPEPRAYQIDANGQITNLSWTPQYSVANNLVKFITGTYNSSLPLVIAIDKSGGTYNTDGLCWSTYFSGSAEVIPCTVQYDKDENIIGSASISNGSFVFSQYGQSTFDASQHKACVFNLYEDFTNHWMTFYGGSRSTYVADMAQKDNGQIYCVGSTKASNIVLYEESGSTSYTYSGEGATSGAFAYDALVFKIDGVNGELLWSTFLGDSGQDFGNDYGKNIIVSSSNKIYVTGEASGANFQHTSNSNAFQGGSNDVFLCEFNANDSHTWTYFLGGADRERPNGLAEDDNGNIWINGATRSSDFPTIFPGSPGLADFFDNQLSGNSDDYITQFSPVSKSIIYSSFFGGDNIDSGFWTSSFERTDYLAIGENRMYFIGRTKSSGSSFPIVQDAGDFNFDQNDLGSNLGVSMSNGYIAAMNTDNYHQTWGTFINDAENGDGSDGKNWPKVAHVKVYTNDTPSVLTIGGDANHPDEMLNPGGGLSYISGPSGLADGFVYVFNAGLTSNSLYHSTFFGGVEEEDIRDIAYINQYKLAICGVIVSIGTDVGFPLDDPGNGAMFSSYLASSSSSNDGFFAAFCDEEVTGIDDPGFNSEDTGIQIFPNPTSSVITIKGSFSANNLYSIYDIYGRMVEQGHTLKSEFRINCSNLSSGTYILRIDSKTQILTGKIIVQ